MNNLSENLCPSISKECLLKGCTFFNSMLGGCEISILTYNLYQLKEHIRAQLRRANGVLDAKPARDDEKPACPRFPRPAQ